MYVKINNVDRNALMITTVVLDDTKVVYTMLNGTKIIEEFDTSSDAEAKYNEVISISGGGGGGGTTTDVQVNGTSITSGGVADILTNSAYDPSSNKLATMNDLPSVPSLPSIVLLTQTEYDNLPSYADNTEYHIIED